MNSIKASLFLTAEVCRFLRFSAMVCLTAAVVAWGQTDAPFQAAARPFGLEIVDSVKLAGSDAASAQFQANVLPSITSLVNGNLGERVNFAQSASFSLDPTKLRMAVESSARVYFVGEGAGYRNTLGFNTLEAGDAVARTSLTDSAQLIFPDASSAVSTYDPAVTTRRTASTPLLPGDFVDAGVFSAGSVLDFFLVANGAGGGRDIWTASASRNADGLDHVVAFALPESPYLIVAFEDLRGGGDRDYNDVVFAVDVGAINVQRLLSTPEPAAWATLAALGGLAWFVRRRLGASDTVALG